MIQEFIKGKKVVYFLFLETSERVNLENFSRSTLNIAMKNINNLPYFANFTDAFETVGDIVADERIILVIDECPYRANSVQGISSVIQAQIDMRLKKSKLFLIFCGSVYVIHGKSSAELSKPALRQKNRAIQNSTVQFF